MEDFRVEADTGRGKLLDQQTLIMKVPSGEESVMDRSDGQGE